MLFLLLLLGFSVFTVVCLWLSSTFINVSVTEIWHKHGKYSSIIQSKKSDFSKFI